MIHDRLDVCSHGICYITYKPTLVPCLPQWLQQCHTQGVTPTCPMCQSTIQVEIKWHFPSLWRHVSTRGPIRRGAFGVGNNFLLARNPRLADLLADMPQLLVPADNGRLVGEVEVSGIGFNVQHQHSVLRVRVQRAAPHQCAYSGFVLNLNNGYALHACVPLASITAAALKDL